MAMAVPRHVRHLLVSITMVATTSSASSSEDPFIWQQPDGSLHCIYHAGPSSYHAFSADGVTWTAPSTKFYNTTVEVASSSGVSASHRDGRTAARSRGGGACGNDTDCSLLGTCVAGACQCHTGFTSPTCGVLDLLPVSTCIGSKAAVDDAATGERRRAPRSLPGVVWPLEGGPNASAWGFTVAYDPSDKKYHAVVDVSCGYTGVLASGGGASTLVHVSSTRPDGGYSFVKVMAPATSFNPHLVRSPQGMFALYFRVNGDYPLPLCSGDVNGPTTSNGSLIVACTSPGQTNCIHAGNAERGTNMFVATSTSMDGPWEVKSVTVAGEGGLHISNPSVAFVRADTPAAKQGSVVLAFRYNGPHGENNGIAFADNPAGPFVAVANLSMMSAPDFPRHFNGTTVVLHRRERPELLLDPSTNTPMVLFTGAEGTDDDGVSRAYSFAQRVAGAGG